MTRTSALQAVATKVTSTTANEALAEAGLAGWNVRKEAMRTSSNVKVTDKKAVVRTDPTTLKTEYMNTCGGRYTIVQNEEHAEFLDLLTHGFGGKYENATQFRNGKLVYLSIKLPNEIKVHGDDRVDLYLNAINSHNGSTPFMVSLDPVRAFCSNQLNYFRTKKTGVFKVRHTSSIGGKLQLAREALGLLMAGVDDFSREAAMLADTTLTNDRFNEIAEELFPAPEKRASSAYEVSRDRLNYLFMEAETNANIRGTAWAGLQAVVEYLDWDQPMKTKTNVEYKRAERILTSADMISKKATAERAFMSLALA